MEGKRTIRRGEFSRFRHRLQLRRLRPRAQTSGAPCFRAAPSPCTSIGDVRKRSDGTADISLIVEGVAAPCRGQLEVRLLRNGTQFRCENGPFFSRRALDQHPLADNYAPLKTLQNS